MNDKKNTANVAKAPPATREPVTWIDWTDPDGNAMAARSARNPVNQCISLITALNDYQRRLMDPATPDDLRKRYARMVGRMHDIYTAKPVGSGDLVRALYEVVEKSASSRASGGSARARVVFVQLLGLRYAPALDRVNAESLAIVDVCLDVWRRRAGRPSVGDVRPTKWEAFARVVEIFGGLPFAPEALRNECRRVVAKGRGARV